MDFRKNLIPCLMLSATLGYGQELVKDVSQGSGDPQITNIYEYNGKLYFLASTPDLDPDTKKIWTTDGTEAGTHTVSDTYVNPAIFATAGDQVVTFGDNFLKINTTNLTTGVTTLFTPFEVNSFSYPNPNNSVATSSGDIFFYLAGRDENDVSTGFELNKANINTNEFGLVKDIVPGDASSLGIGGQPLGVALGDKMIFAVDVSGKEQFNQLTTKNETVIDVSLFARGLYLVLVKDQQQTHHLKFIKR